jgi:hypothetical protein
MFHIGVQVLSHSRIRFQLEWSSPRPRIRLDSLANLRPGRSPTLEKKDAQPSTCAKPHRQIERQRSTGGPGPPLYRWAVWITEHAILSKRRPPAPAFIFICIVISIGNVIQIQTQVEPILVPQDYHSKNQKANKNKIKKMPSKDDTGGTENIHMDMDSNSNIFCQHPPDLSQFPEQNGSKIMYHGIHKCVVNFQEWNYSRTIITAITPRLQNY